MKKNYLIIIIIIVVVAVGGYLIFHKSPKPATTSTTTNTSTSQNQPATSSAIVVTKTSSSLGQYLATPNGYALYTYGLDKSGVSNCTGACAQTWPPYQVTGSTTGLPVNVGAIRRPDSTQTQYTYKGMPLYTFASDSQGQVTGNGVNNFQVAKP
ncbi:MAG TPA: hypothetical protein VNZ45_04235 [Bacteroidia bacterium]|jgi:predicted lipoprotein with Yx(FWY)xxD motif|nr:hypothetical protein [Bacteroidia bacterium]